jgi:hypothetical protein
MDIQEKLVESHKAISKINATLLTLIFVLSVYIMQRALSVIGFSPDLFYVFAGKEVQINFFNLGFAYRTMTAIWPGVLGGLCVVYTLLEIKRCRIEHELKCISNELRNNDIVEVDPFHISALLFRSKTTRRTGQLFGLFPMLAIGTHLLMILMWVVTLPWNARRLRVLHYSPNQDGMIGVSAGAVFSLFCILFAVVGFFGALSFWRTIKKWFDSSGPKESKPATAQQSAVVESDEARVSQEDSR